MLRAFCLPLGPTARRLFTGARSAPGSGRRLSLVLHHHPRKRHQRHVAVGYSARPPGARLGTGTVTVSLYPLDNLYANYRNSPDIGSKLQTVIRTRCEIRYNLTDHQEQISHTPDSAFLINIRQIVSAREHILQYAHHITNISIGIDMSLIAAGRVTPYARVQKDRFSVSTCP